MRTRADFDRLILAEQRPDRRLRRFAALLSEESGLGVEGMTIVGGSAIELYTGGGYVSDDVDVLVADRRRAETVLKRWGFTDEGKLWTRADLRLFVDLMERENTGSRRLTRIMNTEWGSFRVGAIEDLIVKRLRETRYWSQKQAMAQAILLVREFDQDLDWDYIDFFAKQDQIVDLVDETRKRARLKVP